MTLTIELTEEQEERLALRANGQPLDEFARDLLLLAAAKPISGAEALAYWQKEGLIGAWAEREDIGDSTEYARKLRAEVECRSNGG